MGSLIFIFGKILARILLSENWRGFFERNTEYLNNQARGESCVIRRLYLY